MTSFSSDAAGGETDMIRALAPVLAVVFWVVASLILVAIMVGLVMLGCAAVILVGEFAIDLLKMWRVMA